MAGVVGIAGHRALVDESIGWVPGVGGVNGKVGDDCG